ncbi:MAG: arginine--tRNA ligase [Firmicutes bacterium]|jgi:arginyl-tRNA synthetase|nr:arginine--tRNA ligase [Bacillota bacterium]
MSIALELQSRIKQAFLEALNKAAASEGWIIENLPAVELEIPKDKSHGDLATNLAMQLTREVKQAPRRIAELLIQHLDLTDTFIESVEVAGPGFINLRLNNQWLYKVLRDIEEQGDGYGRSNHGQGKKVLLEFVSANPVGPMNVVNARAAAVGDTLANIMEAAGYDVSREYYVNDAGRQAYLFGLSLLARYKELAGLEVEFPEDGYPADYVTELAEVLRQEVPNLLEKSQEEQEAFCKRWGTDRMVEQQKADLAAFGVEFDLWFRERDLHQGQQLDEVIKFMQEAGYLYEEDGAIWFASTRFGDDKDRVMVKSDGELTYLTPDVAYHWNKYRRGFEHLIDIWGPDHHGYIARMSAAIQALGYPADSFEVIILQLVTLLRHGEKVRMSKRAGRFVSMKELLDEVGKDAARYFFLMRAPDSHLDFDMALAVEQSQENPVYYIQYAHARICSILRQAEENGVKLPAAAQADLNMLETEAELDLIKKLAQLPEEIIEAAERREPHRIARYCYELASTFHSFYTHCRVLGEEEALQDARLVLVQATKQVLQIALGILGVSAPEQM